MTRKSITSLFALTAVVISSFVSVPESSSSIIMKTLRAANRNSAEKASSSAAAARSRRSRSSASCSRRFDRPRRIASSHSSMSTSPEPSVSSSRSAWSSRFGCSRNISVSSPHVLRNSLTTLSDLTAVVISSMASEPESSLSISSNTSRALLRNSFVKASFSARAFAAASARSLARCSSLFASACAIAASHSGRSTSPDLSVSSSASVFSSFEGTMRSDRFWLPQEMRNFWTSSSFLTACKISSFVSVPESSLSIMMNTSRAALRKPALNSSSAAAAARSRRSRSSASCSRRFLRPRWIASSPVRKSTSERGPSDDK